MIRKLVESDKESLLEYLNAEESLNIFVLSNIRFFGFEEESLTLYGEFDESDLYLSVLLFVKGSSLFYSHKRLFNIEWLKIFGDHDFFYIGGIESIINKIIPYFKEFKVVRSFIAEASQLNEKYEKSNYDIIKVTTREECEKLYNLLKTIEEFKYRTENKKAFIDIRMKALNMGTVYYIEENGKFVSTVTASGETKTTAVVVMVGTAIEYRNRGLASILIKYLMNDYFENKHKNLCLFYDNPKAGNIYKRLGFIDVEKYVTLIKE